jgi:tripartite-type tricarboxylate transporter receptor subunit TctC
LKYFLTIFFFLCYSPFIYAQDWQNKPIKLIVPFPAGGGTDAVARALANKLSSQINQSIIVENKSGANGVIGADFVARSAPDGSTILLTIASHAIAQQSLKRFPTIQILTL